MDCVRDVMVMNTISRLHKGSSGGDENQLSVLAILRKIIIIKLNPLNFFATTSSNVT